MRKKYVRREKSWSEYGPLQPSLRRFEALMTLEWWTKIKKALFLLISIKKTHLSRFLFVSHSTRLLLKSQNEVEENPIINIEQISQKNKYQNKTFLAFLFSAKRNLRAVFAFCPVLSLFEYCQEK